MEIYKDIAHVQWVNNQPCYIAVLMHDTEQLFITNPAKIRKIK